MGLLIVASLLGALVYAGACWLWPFAGCLRCNSSGKHRSPSGTAWRKCRRCKGSGARLRLGRQVWIWTHRTYTKGSK